MTVSAVLPSVNLERPVRPCVPTTMSSAGVERGEIDDGLCRGSGLHDRLAINSEAAQRFSQPALRRSHQVVDRWEESARCRRQERQSASCRTRKREYAKVDDVKKLKS